MSLGASRKPECCPLPNYSSVPQVVEHSTYDFYTHYHLQIQGL